MGLSSILTYFQHRSGSGKVGKMMQRINKQMVELCDSSPGYEWIGMLRF